MTPPTPEQPKQTAADFHALNERVTTIEKAVEINTKLTTAIATDTSELLALFTAAKGGLTVMGWLGKGVKWLAAIGAAVVGLYVAIQQARGH